MGIKFFGNVKIEHFHDNSKNVTIDKEANVNDIVLGNVHNHYCTNQSSNPTQINVNPAQQEKEATPMMASGNELAVMLLPMFKHEAEVVRQFLTDIQGVEPSGITRIVNEYVKEHKLHEWAKKSGLWSVLNQHGIYKLTESNWNKRVK